MTTTINNNHSKYLQYRQQYTNFYYKSYNYEITDKSVNFNFLFEIDGLSTFTPTWTIDITAPLQENIDLKKLEKLIFSLGMVELVSYWKITCSPNIIVQCGNLSSEEITWWKKLYIKGLGEFLYTNSIPLTDDIMNITCTNSTKFTYSAKPNPPAPQPMPTALIPIGGGKDSVVTIELLKPVANCTCFILNPRKATLDTYHTSNIGKLITANRTLDKNMLDLNKQGYLNGHTPFSALIAFSGVIASYINNIQFVALSNESSANESTVKGTDVNHQYSKSYEFELDFVTYQKEFIDTGVHYFSLLRPFTEIKIASIFANFKQYHNVFTSCNVGSKTDCWCLACSKCLFVNIILSPFLPNDSLDQIFTTSMLDNPDMLDDFKKLIGFTEEKPFECVGSCDEVNAAIQYTIKKYKSAGQTLPKLLDFYDKNYNGKIENLQEYCDSFDEINGIPPIFLPTVTK